MRFEIRDLLMLTAVVALYATGLAISPIREFQRIDLIWFALPLVYVPNAFMALRSRRSAGARVAVWSSPGMWLVHLAFASLFVAFCLYFRAVGMPGKPFSLGVLLPNHLHFLSMSTVTTGQNGVVVGPTLMNRQDYRFRFDPGRRRLSFRRLPGTLRNWSQQASGNLSVPERQLEPVQHWVESLTLSAGEEAFQRK